MNKINKYEYDNFEEPSESLDSVKCENFTDEEDQRYTNEETIYDKSNELHNILGTIGIDNIRYGRKKKSNIIGLSLNDWVINSARSSSSNHSRTDRKNGNDSPDHNYSDCHSRRSSSDNRTVIYSSINDNLDTSSSSINMKEKQTEKNPFDNLCAFDFDDDKDTKNVIDEDTENHKRKGKQVSQPIKMKNVPTEDGIKIFGTNPSSMRHILSLPKSRRKYSKEGDISNRIKQYATRSSLQQNNILSDGVDNVILDELKKLGSEI